MWLCHSKKACKEAYTCETRRFLKFRVDDHRGCVHNFLDNDTGTHFNQPGHSLGNLHIIILKQTKKKHDPYRKKENFITKFYMAYKGMNRKFCIRGEGRT